MKLSMIGLLTIACCSAASAQQHAVAISTATAQQAFGLQQVKVSYGGIAQGYESVRVELWAAPVELYPGGMVLVRSAVVNTDDNFRVRDLILGRSPQLPYSAVGWWVWIRVFDGDIELSNSDSYAVFLP